MLLNGDLKMILADLRTYIHSQDTEHQVRDNLTFTSKFANLLKTFIIIFKVQVQILISDDYSITKTDVSPKPARIKEHAPPN